MNREIYIDLMDKVLLAYTEEHIDEYTRSVAENGICEHGFPRLCANLGILAAHGRKTQYIGKFRKMMDLCCDEIPYIFEKNGLGVGNDFSVKEIVLCLFEVERAKIFDKSVTDAWRKKLAEIVPERVYGFIAATPPERINNWAAFNAASEQLRKYAGIGNESDFIENQIKSQLLSFDENGMYRDPAEPMFYDFVTRLQLAVALYFGFDGESRAALEAELLKSADITLRMQSVTGEIPFGGRSIQFLHNETLYSALLEFYASWFKKRGNTEKASQFKSAARLAAENVIPWLEGGEIHHVKNYYPQNSKFGCEEYAYFDKYMVTAASWLYLAYIMADDSICETPCPAACKDYILETSRHFHKVMCKYHDYFIEFDTRADMHYDASGLGRVQKRGAPSALCLSVPFSAEPNYGIDIKNASSLSVCAGIRTDSGFSYTCENTTEYTLCEKLISDEFIRVKFECKTETGEILHTSYTLSDNGLEIEVSGDGEIEILFPVFEFDGLNYTEISAGEKRAAVSYKGYRCIYETDGTITDKKSVYANRNGHYKAMAAHGRNAVLLKIEIVKIYTERELFYNE